MTKLNIRDRIIAALRAIGLGKPAARKHASVFGLSLRVAPENGLTHLTQAAKAAGYKQEDAKPIARSVASVVLDGADTLDITRATAGKERKRTRHCAEEAPRAPAQSKGINRFVKGAFEYSVAKSEAETGRQRNGDETDEGDQDDPPCDPFNGPKERKIAESGGVYNVSVGPPAFPSASITDDDIIISVDREYVATDGMSKSVNTITASYPDPAQVWEERQARLDPLPSGPVQAAAFGG